MKRAITLAAFLKGTPNPSHRMPGCANLDTTYGGCLFGPTCRVLIGEPCGYFEKAVLPTAADIGQLEHLSALYEQATGRAGVGLSRPAVRWCPDCGGDVPAGSRYCAACAQKRRRAAKRRAWRKHAG